jgi:hypothetical protein
MNRRKFLQLSALAGLTPVHAMEPAAKPASMAGSPKKGFCIGTKSGGYGRILQELRAKWFYTWNHKVPGDKPAGVDFVPMIWKYHGRKDVVLSAAKAAKAAGSKELLGFNEPDQKKQAEMTVEEALAAWPVLQKTGLRLGSPGCVHPDKEWMKAFMKEVAARKLRVDFVCVHSYGGADADALVRRLEQVHQLYNKPIWITEFAVGDWTAQTVAENRYKEDAVLRFMEQVLPKLDRLDFVERYAWFSAKPDNKALGTSALLDAEGKLTRLGECYRDA